MGRRPTQGPLGSAKKENLFNPTALIHTPITTLVFENHHFILYTQKRVANSAYRTKYFTQKLFWKLNQDCWVRKKKCLEFGWCCFVWVFCCFVLLCLPGFTVGSWPLGVLSLPLRPPWRVFLSLSQQTFDTNHRCPHKPRGPRERSNEASTPAVKDLKAPGKRRRCRNQ